MVGRMSERPILVQVHLAPGSPNETFMDEIPELYSSISDSFVSLFHENLS